MIAVDENDFIIWEPTTGKELPFSSNQNAAVWVHSLTQEIDRINSLYDNVTYF